MTDILAALDGALDSHAHAAAEVTGNPWPGRVPSLDEMLEAVFGPEDGAPLATWEEWYDAQVWAWTSNGWEADQDPIIELQWGTFSIPGGEMARTFQPGSAHNWARQASNLYDESTWLNERAERENGSGPVVAMAEHLGVPMEPWQRAYLDEVMATVYATTPREEAVREVMRTGLPADGVVHDELRGFTARTVPGEPDVVLDAIPSEYLA